MLVEREVRPHIHTRYIVLIPAPTWYEQKEEKKIIYACNIIWRLDLLIRNSSTFQQWWLCVIAGEMADVIFWHDNKWQIIAHICRWQWKKQRNNQNCEFSCFTKNVQTSFVGAIVSISYCCYGNGRSVSILALTVVLDFSYFRHLVTIFFSGCHYHLHYWHPPQWKKWKYIYRLYTCLYWFFFVRLLLSVLGCCCRRVCTIVMPRQCIFLLHHSHNSGRMPIAYPFSRVSCVCGRRRYPICVVSDTTMQAEWQKKWMQRGRTSAINEMSGKNMWYMRLHNRNARVKFQEWHSFYLETGTCTFPTDGRIYRNGCT